MFENQKLHICWFLLKITYGIVPIVAGLDKFTNILAYWPQYLHPSITHALPLSALTVSYIVGIIEIIAGILVLTYTRIGAYIVASWLICISINLLAMGKYLDVAVRDIVMAVGALVLAWLTEIKEHKY
jgi:uncharacterized membrane protein YphA (DoxX/SURF4 family)